MSDTSPRSGLIARNLRRSMHLLFGLLLIWTGAAWSQDATIQGVIDTYNANQARFHQQYRNRALQGNGIVRDISADFLGTGAVFFVQLDVNGSGVQCIVYDKHVAASLNKGQLVHFQGVMHDVILGKLQVDRCGFAAQAPSRPQPLSSPPSQDIGSSQRLVLVNTPGDGFLALRSRPTTKKGKRLHKIPHDTLLKLGDCTLDETGSSWCETTFLGDKGWICEEYVVSATSEDGDL